MPVNGFSVGRDVTLNINDQSGALSFGLITNFNSKPDVVDKKVTGIDGLARHVIFHDGWSGTFELERQNSDIDDYWALLETNYYMGVDQQSTTIIETITEVNGSITQYIYTGVIFKLEDAGEWKGDDTVKQKLSFFASRKQKVS